MSWVMVVSTFQRISWFHRSCQIDMKSGACRLLFTALCYLPGHMPLTLAIMFPPKKHTQRLDLPEIRLLLWCCCCCLHTVLFCSSAFLCSFQVPLCPAFLCLGFPMTAFSSLLRSELSWPVWEVTSAWCLHSVLPPSPALSATCTIWMSHFNISPSQCPDVPAKCSWQHSVYNFTEGGKEEAEMRHSLPNSVLHGASVQPCPAKPSRVFFCLELSL